jgi:hypothetical protein
VSTPKKGVTRTHSVADAEPPRVATIERALDPSRICLGLSAALTSLASSASFATEPPWRVTAANVEAYASCDEESWASDSIEDALGVPDGILLAAASEWYRSKSGGMGCSGSSQVTLRIENASLSINASMGGVQASLGAHASATIAIDRPYWMQWTPSGWPWNTNIPGIEPIRIEPGVHSVSFQSGCGGWGGGCSAAGVVVFSRVYPLDIHPDGFVDALDLAEVLGHWGPCDAERTAADVNLDGSVDSSDLALVLTGWQTDGRVP